MDHLNEEMLEKIDAYLSDELNPQEKVAFESLLSSDNKLAREVALQHLVRSSLRKIGEISPLTEEKEKFLNILQNIHNEHVNKRSLWIKKPGFRIALTAAASLVLIFLVIRFWPHRPTPQEIFAQNYSSPIDISRGLTGVPEKLQAFEKTGNYSLAIVYLDSVKGLDTESRHFYKSHFYYLNSDSLSVFNALEPILGDSTSRYFDQALVNQGLLYLKFGNTDLSYSTFHSISQTNSRYISSRSKKIASEVLLFLKKE